VRIVRGDPDAGFLKRRTDDRREELTMGVRRTTQKNKKLKRTATLASTRQRATADKAAKLAARHRGC
jgi:hypothetical protein